MPRKQKRELVTVSFHYLCDREEGSDGEFKDSPIDQSRFDTFKDRLTSLEPLDLSDEKVADSVRSKQIVPIDHVENIDDRTLFGSYRAGYWGHAYENTVAGKIPSDSISLRPFYFLIYFSESGRMYIGVQYLGQFGSYTALKNTLSSMINGGNKLHARSFRTDTPYVENIEAREVRVQVSRHSADIASDNSFGTKVMIAFQKQDRSDGFSADVKKNILPWLGNSRDKVQHEVAAMLKRRGLMDVADEDILDCSVIAEVDGRSRTIHMIQQGSYASQFPISVGFNDDGHPVPDLTRKAMLDLLEHQIIKKKEDA